MAKSLGLPDGEYTGLRCNASRGDSSVAKGAALWVQMIPGEPSRIWVLARSRSGRWIERWMRLSDLTNPRLKTIVPGSPMHGRAWPHAQASLDRLAMCLQDPELNRLRLAERA